METFQKISSKPSICYLNPISLSPDRLDASYYAPEFLEAANEITWSYLKSRTLASISSKLNCGATPKLVVYKADGLPLVRTSNVRPNIYNEEGVLFVHGRSLSESSNLAISPGDVLYTMSGTIGYATVYPFHAGLASFSNTIARARIDEGDPYYVALFLNSRLGMSQSMRFVSGGVLAHVMPTSVKKIKILSPVKEIQHAIGNKVRKAERLRELAADDNRNLENTLVSILGVPDENLASTKVFWTETEFLSANRINASEYHPHTLQAEYQIAHSFNGQRLAKVMVSRSDLSGGATPSGAEYPVTGIAFLRVQNVQPNRLDLSDAVYIDDQTNHELRRSIVRENDILLTITGNPGSACCVQKRDLPLNINQHCVRFHVSEEWNPFYVAAFINCPWGKLQVTRRSIGGTRDALDYPSVLSLLIPTIPREQQDQIGNLAKSYADALTESGHLIEAAKADVEALISNTLDLESLQTESAAIEAWLSANPSPAAQKN